MSPQLSVQFVRSLRIRLMGTDQSGW